MIRKPIIISIKSYKLSRDEKNILINQKPWGVILFKRNIFSFDQLKKLTNDIRKCLRDPFYPILVDEEGGKVSRFSNLYNSREFSQKFFGDLYKKNKKNSKYIYEYYLNSISSVLKKTGININTIPVLDILYKSTNNIIKGRSYSSDINTVKNLGNICIDVLRKNKIGSVVKHVPGHGSATADSHVKRPVVNKSYKKLYNSEFVAFKSLNSHFLMTAHILYKKIDPINVATQSKEIIINIIRKKLNFKGLIISDDLSMKALGPNLIENAKKSLNAGCNLVLYCKGKTKESYNLLKSLNNMDIFTTKKTQQFYKFLR